MATKKRTRPSDLRRLQEISDDPFGYHVFHALRLVDAAFPDKPRLGESVRPADDAIRITQEVEMAFPPSAIRSLEMPEDDRPGILTNRVFGLFGPQGPMPTFFTEYIRDRVRNHRDRAAADFLSMFIHRMTTLLYRAWASAEPAVCFDRVEDGFSDKVDAIAGYRGMSLANADLMPDLTKRHFAAHLAHRTRNVEGLQSILAAFFEAPVEIEDFVGSWLRIEPSDRWVLGDGGKLGETTLVGEQSWSRSAKFRIRIGPVGLESYRRMFPGEKSLERLQAIIRNYCGDTMDWELNLVLRAEEVPKAGLGDTAILGFSCWPGERDGDADAADLYITPETGQAA